MSNSTSSANTTNSTSATSTYPTTGSSFGALKYNINSMTGWMLGAPSADDIYLYSDLAVDTANNGFYIFYEDPSVPLFTGWSTTYSDQTLVKSASQALYSNGVIQVDTFSPTDYATQFSKLDGILGMSWLPWNTYGVKNADGNYCVKRYYLGTNYIQANLMSGSALETKLITTLKLAGISIAIYFGGKFIYKLSKRK